MSTTTLDRMPVGMRGVISAVDGPAVLRRRLLEMGLCTDVPVELLRRAPLGDPLEVRVRGYLLSLRHEQARHVTVIAPVGAPAGI